MHVTASNSHDTLAPAVRLRRFIRSRCMRTHALADEGIDTANYGSWFAAWLNYCPDARTRTCACELRVHLCAFGTNRWHIYTRKRRRRGRQQMEPDGTAVASNSKRMLKLLARVSQSDAAVSPFVVHAIHFVSSEGRRLRAILR